MCFASEKGERQGNEEGWEERGEEKENVGAGEEAWREWNQKDGFVLCMVLSLYDT